MNDLYIEGDAILLDGLARRGVRAGGRLPGQLHRLPRQDQRRPDRTCQVGPRESGNTLYRVTIRNEITSH